MSELEPQFHNAECTAGDGYRWKYRRYVPDDTPVAHVVCVHGIQSHAGWYGYSCERLRRAGFVVSFLDRRGSGMNEAARGDAPSFRRLIDDIAEFLLLPVKPPESADDIAWPKLPVLLAAISWGGKVAVGLQSRHPGLVNGLALLCPGFFPKVKVPRLARLGIAANRLVRPAKLFPIPLNEPDLFTATPRWQEFIRNDPLSLREATSRLLVESVRLDMYLRFAPKSVRVPVLLMLAGQDRIIDNERARQYVDKFATSEHRVIEYPDAHHTLEFEEKPDGFIDDLIGWCRGHA